MLQMGRQAIRRIKNNPRGIVQMPGRGDFVAAAKSGKAAAMKIKNQAPTYGRMGVEFASKHKVATGVGVVLGWSVGKSYGEIKGRSGPISTGKYRYQTGSF